MRAATHQLLTELFEHTLFKNVFEVLGDRDSDCGLKLGLCHYPQAGERLAQGRAVLPQSPAEHFLEGGLKGTHVPSPPSPLLCKGGWVVLSSENIAHPCSAPIRLPI